MKLVPDEFTGRQYGKYEVLCRLAVGGMAEIFLGFARSGPFLNRPVVLKNVLPEQREDPSSLRMLIDEARVTATLSHGNIAQVVDLERAGDDVLMVSEFIAGANLEEIVAAWGAAQEPVPLGFALTVVREVAQGLSHAHLAKDPRGLLAPIVHRDVTPRNIMSGFDGTTKVLDFGIARAVGAQRRTAAGMVRGTTAYMSPEQAVGKDLDPRSDLFSLGIVFYELLTGQRLFARDTPGAEMAAVYESEILMPSRVHRRVPRALDAVVMKLIERNREKRYQSALEFVRDLSLAAGSTAWNKDRCAEMVNERFPERRALIDKLLERIPRGVSATSIARSDVVPPVPAIKSNTPSRSLASAPHKPSSERLAVVELSPKEAPAKDGFSKDGPTAPMSNLAGSASSIVRQPTASSSSGKLSAPPAPLTEAALFSDLDDGSAEETRVVYAGRSARSSPKAVRDGHPRQSPRSLWGPIVVAVLVTGAAVVGAAAVYVKRLQPTGFGRLSVTTDRPATVVLLGQRLGVTPLEAMVPVGSHSLELTESDGKVRVLRVEVVTDRPARQSVSLDTLPVRTP